MIAPTQLKKPANWQDFEKLCKKLWGEIWECPDTIQRNGRTGQKQNGIDVCGQPKGKTCYYGIQCKGKDDYSNSQLTKNEINEEIEKALNFKPELKRLIFATTANKDVEIEEYIRLKNIENNEKSLFEVFISSWEDIVDLLEERKDTYQWYVNNCQYLDSCDVDVLISDGNIIRPEYYKITKKFKLFEPIPSHTNFYKNPNLLKQLDLYPKNNTFVFNINNIINPPREIDCRWCYIYIKIINKGSKTIEDFNLSLLFDCDSIEQISDNNSYIYNPLIPSVERQQINRQIDDEREVYKSNKYNNVINYYPKKKVLVQKDSCCFKVGVIPKSHETKEIKLNWELKARDFNKKGVLKINVRSYFENKEEVKRVNSESDIRQDEVIIEPKIEISK